MAFLVGRCLEWNFSELWEVEPKGFKSFNFFQRVSTSDKDSAEFQVRKRLQRDKSHDLLSSRTTARPSASHEFIPSGRRVSRFHDGMRAKSRRVLIKILIGFYILIAMKRNEMTLKQKGKKTCWKPHGSFQSFQKYFPQTFHCPPHLGQRVEYFSPPGTRTAAATTSPSISGEPTTVAALPFWGGSWSAIRHLETRWKRIAKLRREWISMPCFEHICWLSGYVKTRFSV